jgi:N-acetylglutamate synthase-like GNAT family acetyltransferase
MDTSVVAGAPVAKPSAAARTTTGSATRTGQDGEATMMIRNATAADALALTTMVRTSAAYDGAYRVMVANQTIDAAYLTSNPVRVAHGPDGQLLGFYGLLIPGMGSAGEGELDFMFVANDSQRRGVGRALIHDLRVLAGQLQLARVRIVSHPPAEGFYQAMGARRVGTLPPSGRVAWSRPNLILDL